MKDWDVGGMGKFCATLIQPLGMIKECGVAAVLKDTRGTFPVDVRRRSQISASNMVETGDSGR